MTGLIEAYWAELEKTVKKHRDEEDENILFYKDKYELFKENFNALYKKIKMQHMKPKVDALDSHKVVAVMLISVLQSNVISYAKELKQNQVFLGPHMFATEVALSWMLDLLNKKLSAKNIPEISAYVMPTPFTCNTPYFDVFSRNLYLSEKEYCLNPLDIAEKLFLLEYITLIKNNIDPAKLKD
ncbi:MAG: hypothetical protein IJW55_07510 [Clostridia bacterium]|nr:hypothetical protein [Clostridia bacterium]